MSNRLVISCACVILAVWILGSNRALSQQGRLSNVPPGRQGDIQDCHSKGLPIEPEGSQAGEEGWVRFCELWQALVKRTVIVPMEEKYGNIFVSGSVSTNGVDAYSQEKVRFTYNKSFKLYPNHRIVWDGPDDGDVSPSQYKRQYYQQFLNDLHAKERQLQGQVPNFPPGSRLPYANWNWHFEFPGRKKPVY
jgi:hypothetical protein